MTHPDGEVAASKPAAATRTAIVLSCLDPDLLAEDLAKSIEGRYRHTVKLAKDSPLAFKELRVTITVEGS